MTSTEAKVAPIPSQSGGPQLTTNPYIGILGVFLGAGTATVVEHLGRITGYASDIAFFSHAVGETNQDLIALIAAAQDFSSKGGFILPTRNGELFRWCLQNGLRLVHQMTLMTIGLYNEPAGAYLPSVLY